MKQENEELSAQLEAAFGNSCEEGFKMLMQNLNCISEDPDVLCLALGKISMINENNFAAIFGRLAQPAYPQNRTIPIYLYLPIRVLCEQMRMDALVELLDTDMQTCCKMGKTPIFRVGEVIVSLELPFRKAFLQSIRRALEIADSEKQIDLLATVYRITQQLWKCNADRNAVVEAIVAICNEDKGFFDWMCKTPFAPIIRCQAMAFLAMANDASHLCNTAAKQRLPLNWRMNALLYRQGVQNARFTQMTTQQQVLPMFQWGAQVSMQLHFADVPAVQGLIQAKGWNLLRGMAALELPIRMDMAVSFAAVFLDADTWRGTRDLDASSSLALAYLLVMGDPAIDWLVMRFLCDCTGKVDVQESEAQQLLAQWNPSGGYAITTGRQVPYLQVTDRNAMLVAELLPVCRRDLTKGQGEDFVNDLDFLQGLMQSRKEDIDPTQFQAATTALNAYQTLRKDPNSDARSYILPDCLPDYFNNVCIRCDLNHLLFPAMKTAMECVDLAAFAHTVFYLVGEDAFVPLVLDTQILLVIVLSDNRNAQAEKAYIQTQIDTLRALLSALHQGLASPDNTSQ